MPEQVDMNNFYAWLPGGYKREFYDEDEGCARVIDTVDSLLEGEFADLDAKMIMEVMLTTHTTVMTAMRKGLLNAEKVSLDERMAIAEREEEKLRPLFNRLVELGFDPGLLTR